MEQRNVLANLAMESVVVWYPSSNRVIRSTDNPDRSATSEILSPVSRRQNLIRLPISGSGSTGTTFFFPRYVAGIPDIRSRSHVSFEGPLALQYDADLD